MENTDKYMGQHVVEVDWKRMKNHYHPNVAWESAFDGSTRFWLADNAAETLTDIPENARLFRDRTDAELTIARLEQEKGFEGFRFMAVSFLTLPGLGHEHDCGEDVCVEQDHHEECGRIGCPTCRY